MKVNRISNHNIMKKIACFILLSSYLLVLTSLQAQSVSVKGTVRDAKTGEVLPMVNVGLMRVTDTVFVRGAATEFDGTFHIKDVKPGKYLLQASFVGYEKYLKEIEVRGNIDKLEISLKGGTTLGEVKRPALRQMFCQHLAHPQGEHFSYGSEYRKEYHNRPGICRHH